MITRIIALVFLAPIVFGLSIIAASEWGGEVIEIETLDNRGTQFHTSLWVVDLYGDSWLRGGDPDAAWVQRIRAQPGVFMTRNGEKKAYHAEIVEDFADRINDGMREKYGWADQLIALIHDESEVVAIRLFEPDPD